MLKKTITFKDLDNKEVTEDFYFHLSKAAVLELELGYEGGLSDHLKNITGMNEDGEVDPETSKKNGGKIIASFKEILRQSCGRRSSDGRRFEQSAEIWNDFVQTDAYSVLLLELCTDAEKAAEFIRGIVPSDMGTKVDTPLALVPPAEDPRPAWIREDRDPTEAELRSMSPDQLREAMAKKLGMP